MPRDALVNLRGFLARLIAKGKVFDCRLRLHNAANDLEAMRPCLVDGQARLVGLGTAAHEVLWPLIAVVAVAVTKFIVLAPMLGRHGFELIDALEAILRLLQQLVFIDTNCAHPSIPLCALCRRRLLGLGA